MDIGKRIINMRERKGWSQRELANRVGLNFSVMNRIEAGDRPVRDSELTMLANVLDVSADELLGLPVDNTRSIMGKDVDTSNLSENQRLVLDWAMAQDALSFHDMSKADLEDILENLSVIFEYEKNKRNAKKK